MNRVKTNQANQTEQSSNYPNDSGVGYSWKRAQIPLKEHSGILNMTQGLNIDNLKRVMTESFPDMVLKDIDGRTATTAHWQQRSSTKSKPFHKKKRA